MDKSLADEWLRWMQEVHIPEVMQTRCFTSFKIMRLLTAVSDDDGANFAIQYTAVSLEMYEKYRDEFGPAMQARTREKYGESITAFRSLLEEITP